MNQAARYRKLLSLTQRNALDESYHAAFYLLSTDQTLFKKACPYVSVDGIDFPAMKRNCRDLDDTQKKLLSIAHNLFSWTSPCKVTPFEIPRLEYPLIDYFCSALYIANGMVQIQVQENDVDEPEFFLNMSRYNQTKKIYDKLNTSSQWEHDVIEMCGIEPD